jgi:hypothetical protein
MTPTDHIRNITVPASFFILIIRQFVVDFNKIVVKASQFKFLRLQKMCVPVI